MWKYFWPVHVRYLCCLFAHKGVQHILCCIFALFLLLCLLAIVSLSFNLRLLITAMVPSNVPSLSLFALFLLFCLLAHCISVLQFIVSDYPYGAFKCSLSKFFCFVSIALSFGALYLCPSIYGF